MNYFSISVSLYVSGLDERRVLQMIIMGFSNSEWKFIVEVALAPSEVYIHAYMEITCRYRHTCRPRSYSSMPIPSARVF